jgi:hypothetical protein
MTHSTGFPLISVNELTTREELISYSSEAEVLIIAEISLKFALI